MKKTMVTPEEGIEQRARKGFQSICCYGSIKPEIGEIGGIFKNVRNARIEHGVFVHEAECIERIFVKTA